MIAKMSIIFYLIIFQVNFYIFTAQQELESKCGPNENNVQIIGKRAQSNGCSKPSFIQVVGEENFTYCCDLHDTCYELCGSSKTYCDLDFKQCMLRLCSTVYKSNPRCSQAAEMYAMGTQMFGNQGYADSQNEYCECISKENTYQHYIDYITDFYINIEESKRKDAIQLLNTSKYIKNKEKGNQNSNSDEVFHLFYNLYKKYHSVIEHVGARLGQIAPKPKIKSQEL